MSFNLNRIKHFPNINHFPVEVLKALVHTCGATVTSEQIREREKDILNFVKNYKSYISEDFDNINSTNDYIKIATYIGSLGGWRNKDNLLQALKNIIIFNDTLDIESIIEKYGDLEINYKMDSKLYSLDILMAYRYCLEKDIKIDTDDSIIEIKDKIKKYLERVKNEKVLESSLEDVMPKIDGGEKRYSPKNIETKDLDGGEKRYSPKNIETKVLDGGEKRYSPKNIETKVLDGGEKRYSIENDTVTKLREGEKRYLEKISSLEEKLESDKRSYLEVIENKERSLSKYKDLERALESKNLELTKYRDLESALESKNLEIENYKDLESRLNIKINELENKTSSVNVEVDKNPYSLVYKDFKDNLNGSLDLGKVKTLLKKPILNLIISKALLSKEESIFIALRVFNFDLRDSPDIYKDLQDLNTARKEKIDYYPNKERKDIFSRNIHLNKNYYSTSHYYNLELKDFYTPKTLELLYNEYNLMDQESLEKFYKTNNFHRGWLQGDVTSYYSQLNLKNFNHNSIISFGIPSKRVVNFTVTELTEYLQNKGNIDPINNQALDGEQIKGLKNICQTFNDNLNYRELASSIDVKKLMDNTNIKTFIEKYLFASDLVRKVLDHLFRIGMFMRGWRINSTSMMVYPLAKKDCVVYKDYKEKIDANIKRVLDDFNHDLEKIQDLAIKNTIKRLPLVSYREREFFYDNSYNSILELVNTLESFPEDMLVLSDKFILASYYYTNISIGKKIFSIDSLELF